MKKERLFIVLPAEVLKCYKKLAKQKGMSVNMYCASLLCEFSEIK